MYRVVNIYFKIDGIKCYTIIMAIVEEAKICLTWFGVGGLIFFLSLFDLSFLQNQLSIALIGHIIVSNIIIYFGYRQKIKSYHVAVRALGLGHAFGLGLILALSTSSVRLFGWYVTVLAFFHVSEYMTTALTNSKTLTLESFLLDHSREYHMAAGLSLVEFAVEWYFFGAYKVPNWISMFGLVMVLCGEFTRKLSMITAATNFHHYVQERRQRDHELVTHGIYSWFRHPSYVGWFYWSIGTQVMLCNPVCIIGYSFASWKFFEGRIHYEEICLLNFFGESYREYQKKVPTGLPFIKGYIPTY